MLVPLYLLAIGAVLAGVIFQGRFYGEEYAEFWKGALFTGAENELVEEIHHVPAWVVDRPFIAMVLGFVTAWYMSISARRDARACSPQQHRVLYQFLLNKWYFDELYDFLFVRSAKCARPLPVEEG